MEEIVKKPVVSLDAHRANSQSRIEVEGARRCISMLSWDLQVQQAIALCGLSVSEALLSEKVIPGSMSHAAQLGHQSLESLVSKSEAEDGLGLEWGEFKNKIKALVYKQKFSINEASYEEINNRVHDAVNIIGRMPVDAYEFHSAKEKALVQNTAQLRKELQARIDSLQEKQRELVLDLNKEKNENGELKQAQTALMQESASKIQAMTRELAVKLEASEKDNANKLKTEAKRLEEDFNLRLQRARQELTHKLDEAETCRQEAEQGLRVVTAKIESGELIEASRIREYEVKLESARENEAALRHQMIEINDQLTQSKIRLDAAEDQNDGHLRTIEQLNSQIALLEQRMRDVLEDKLGSSEFAVLHERLEMRKQEIVELNKNLRQVTSERDAYKRVNSEIKGRFKQMKAIGSEHFKKLTDQITMVNGEYAKLRAEHGQVKLLMKIGGGVMFLGYVVLAFVAW